MNEQGAAAQEPISQIGSFVDEVLDGALPTVVTPTKTVIHHYEQTHGVTKSND